jgi:tryptophan 2,3-dioxygenase
MKYQENLTPFQFAEFRSALETASGAQSQQFKMLLTDLARYREAFIRLLQKRGLLKQVYEPEEVLKAIRRVYLEARFAKLMKIADALYDYEEAFKDHRWQHLKVVRRVIGKAPGTGGTSGIPFLEARLASSFFEELTSVRSQIVNRVRSVKFTKLKP